MKIKGTALYKKMCRDNILLLPSQMTLQNYMKNLKPLYGFQENVFNTLGEKVKKLDVNEQHDKLYSLISFFYGPTYYTTIITII